ISPADDGMRSPLPDSLHIFNAISGTPTAATIQGLPHSSSVFAIKNRFRHRSSRYPKREHWMDWADEKYDSRQLNTFFSVFYLCINAGSLLSTLITPVLRAQECGIHTQQQCYPLAFGVPAALMVISLVVFISGSGMYIKTDPEGNIMWSVCKCIGGSRWTLQATTMTGDFGAFILQPDQMQTVNPILILTLVPIMDRLIFPLIQKCGLNFSPLKRMTVGMLFAAMAFVSAALVQIEIDKTLPNFPSSSESQLKVVNIYNRTLNVTISPNEHLLIDSFESSADYVTLDHQNITVSLNTNPVIIKAFSLIKGGRQTLIIPSDPTIMYMQEDIKSKPNEGKHAIRFVNGWTADLNITNLDSIEPSAASNYTLVSHGKHDFVLRHGEQWCEFSRKFGFGASYTFLIPSTVFSTDCASIREVVDMKPNSVHMALQIPQYFLITTGEVMFSVTGLQFSYSQVFSIMAYFYTYIDPAEIEAQIRIEQGLEPEEKEKETLEIEEIHESQNIDQEVKQTKI
ncbi:solute carrier family 15 member 1-like, partial [Sinocyclocheilus grahami]|uniref:solute carrier family 15 member 1-like n=1 Tax=Sinocyclocheilus grahami TaxID=75366 RepID=UPI0007ACCD44